MSMRAELEAELAQAEAGRRKASDDLEQAQVVLSTANTSWDRVVTDRRKTEADRRKPGAVWLGGFTDRRDPNADRRSPEASLAALAKAVADRDKAYTERSKAESDYANAEVRLNMATVERNRAKAALDELIQSEKKR